MCFVKYHVLIFCLIILECYALNCRSDGGPKEADLKNVYKRCLKMQEGKYSNTSKNQEQDWREPRHNEKFDWDDDRNRGRDERHDDRGDRNNGRDRMLNNNRKNGRDDSRRNDEKSNDRIGNNRMGGKNERNDMSENRDDRYGRGDYFNGRENFPRSDEFGDETSQYNKYYSSTQATRRYKRDKKQENSGHRSQYNPNTKKNSGFEENYRSEDRNSSENSSRERDANNKPCAMHCFLESLEMVGEDGMPDRYLVTHVITKDVKNEDLRDFLQESIEECFQILDNENTEDKCDFSKNLLMCLSEKGRANCDDWKDDLSF